MITSRAIKVFEGASQFCCSIAAAVLGAGALSAGAGIWGASKASDAQTSASQASIANQQQMYAQNKNMLSPFIGMGAEGIPNLQNWTNPNDPNNTLGKLQNWWDPAGGTGGNNPLSSLIKLTTPGADMSATLAQTPGYQFAQSQGTRAALNALAGRGLGGSPGAIAKGVGGYVTGLAGNTWQNVVNSLQNTVNTGGAGLQSAFASGGSALQNLVNTGLTGASSLAGVGTNTTNQISGALTGAGNAQAAGYNAIGSAIGGFGNNATTAALLNQLQSGGGGGGIYGNNANTWQGNSSVGGAPLSGYG